MDGADLVITVDDFVKASGNQEKASTAQGGIRDAHQGLPARLHAPGQTHLKFTVEGTLANGQSSGPEPESIVLTKAD